MGSEVVFIGSIYFLVVNDKLPEAAEYSSGTPFRFVKIMRIVEMQAFCMMKGNIRLITCDVCSIGVVLSLCKIQQQ